MPALSSYDFATVRIVPRTDREEFLNAGVILFCLERKYLGAAVHLHDRRLLAMDSDADLESIRRHLKTVPKICEGLPDAGAIAQMTIRERFHWLVAPRSAVIQISPVHTGLCSDPEDTLQQLFKRLVL